MKLRCKTVCQNRPSSHAIIYMLLSILMCATCAKRTKDYSKHEIQLMPATLYGEVNSSVILPCRIQRGSLAQSIMESYVVMWKRIRDGVYIIYKDINMLKDSRFKISSNESSISMLTKDLLISPVKKTDEGEYKCMVSNGQQVFKKVLSLRILMAPIILSNGSSPLYAPFNEGATANFSCNAWGRPFPNITWYFRSAGYAKVQLSTSPQNGIYVEGSRLYMKNINKHQQGIVTCVAKNGVGSEVMRDVKLDVFYPPIINMINTKIGQQLHRTTMVKAEIHAYPVREIYWKFKGQVIRPQDNENQCIAPMKYQKYCVNIDTRSTSHYHEATLWISNLTDSDYGHYHCFVESPFGIYENNTEVVKSHPPIEKYRYNRPDLESYNYDTENSRKESNSREKYGVDSGYENRDKQYEQSLKNSQGIYPASQTKNSWSTNYKNGCPMFNYERLSHIPMSVLSLVICTFL